MKKMSQDKVGEFAHQLPSRAKQTWPGENTVLHKLVQHGSFQWAAVLQELLKHGSYPLGTVLQEEPGCPWAAAWISVPTWSSLGCGGTTCFTTVFYMDCKGISALACGASPPPSFSLTLLCAGLVLSHFFSNFFHSCFTAVFCPFLNMLSQRFHQLMVLSFGQQCFGDSWN